VKHLLALGPALSLAQEKPKKSLKDVRQALAVYLASTPGKPREQALEKRRKAGLDDVLLSRADAQAVEKMILAAAPPPRPKRGDYTIDLEIAGKKPALHVHPGVSDGKSPVPLVVALHGGSEETTSYEGSRVRAQIPAEAPAVG
jgi:hypothetical protein